MTYTEARISSVEREAARVDQVLGLLNRHKGNKEVA
jgi:hypothetical protein